MRGFWPSNVLQGIRQLRSHEDVGDFNNQGNRITDTFSILEVGCTDSFFTSSM